MVGLRGLGLCLLLSLLLASHDAAGQVGGLPERVPPIGMKPLADAQHEVIYDPATQRYLVYSKVGGVTVGQPRVMTAEEYRDFRREEAMRAYWRGKGEEGNAAAGSSLLPQLQVGGESFDRIFGSNTIEIVPQASAELLFGITNSRTDNYALPEDLRSNTTFDFDTKLQVNLTGLVGTKLRMDIQYNTEATFDFEQNVKVEYTGTEDEMVQKVVAGNVTMPLPGSLITGSQSLFGFRTDLKFGRLDVSTILSQRKGQSQSIEVKGGAQSKRFEVRADQYEANKHFFLSHYFQQRYDAALAHLPLINSGVEITKVEVWITNKQSRFDDSRDLVAFVDLAEVGRDIYARSFVTPTPGAQAPANESNSLYGDMARGPYAGIRQLANVTPILAPLASRNFRNGQDYEKLENARRLKPSEYTLNAKLGYISLNLSLNADEILAVAYEYTLNGRTYKVGELSTDGVDAPQSLIVKLLKGTDLSPAMPTWRLMMKNIYALNAYQVSSQDFNLDVLYVDDEIGTPVNYLSVGAVRHEPLLSVLNLDNLNPQGNTGPDGVFDFVEGVTVLSATGRVIFPMVEPFGEYLARKIGDPVAAGQVVYRELYDSTLSRAQQSAEKNRFILRGEYRSSSSSEIPLNAPNVPRGSVVVTAGGKRLVENTDYVVDYLLGTVRIINQGLLESGTPINISLESNLGIDFQTKTLVGTHLNYRVSDRFNVGGTVLNLTERPLTKKVNYGSEAMSNTIWGLNLSYEEELPWLTRAIDFLPLLETKESSSLSFEAEMAHFIPGQSGHLDKRASVYLDDFEANKSTIDLRMWSSWSLASTPQGQPTLFPEGDLVDDLRYGMGRSRLAWYTIDPLFLRNSSITPAHIRNNPESQSSHFVREVEEQELFPNRQTPQGLPNTVAVLNVAYYPSERGPYNYDADGVQEDGSLANPEKRWGGMMRSLPLTDFESSNIEYIEFWLMDPFVEGGGVGGDLFFNLGNVSEDILRDGRKAFENGLGVEGAEGSEENSAWGRVPKTQSSVMAFDNDPAKRAAQDVGLDGLSSTQEQLHFAQYLQRLEQRFGAGSPVVESARVDPSSDNYRYFRSRVWDEQSAGILERYKYYNNTEGNSPTAEQSPESYPTSASTLPDVEDLNRDNTLSDNESYYQYRVSIRPGDLKVGVNNVTDKVVARVKLANGEESEVAWYQFKIPVREYGLRVGHIQDFKSIRFIRMYLRNFSQPVVMRFATLGLVRGEWRRYDRSLLEAQELVGAGGNAGTTFEVSAVNIEENNARTPVNYILPPNVTREIDASQAVENELNEQSMELKVVGLVDGDARAAYRSVGYDLRQYKRLALDVHAEAVPGYPLADGDLSLFLRLGTDYSTSYYEYEVPLRLTAPGYYSNSSEADRLLVWPVENALDLDLSIFTEAKLQRDDAVRGGGGGITARTPFSVSDGERRVTVLGYPNLGDVRVLMIGVRNPRKRGGADDGYPKAGVVWVNELRLSRIADRGGWAALASMNMKMADLGMLSVSGRLETPGFGALESRMADRSREMTYQYDANATLELGRFFPKKWEVSIPMFIGYGETYANPEFNPLDPDVHFEDALRHMPNGAARDSLRRIAQDYMRRRSINFTNVRVNRMSQNPRLWDPANFSASYSYSEVNARNVRTEYRNQVNHRGSFAYTYNARPQNVQPFRGWGWLSSPHLALIRDFSFAYLPKQLSFRTEVSRSYLEQRLRNINSPMLQMRPSYAKGFDWHRVYGLNWDLTPNLRLDFTANNVAVIDEPEGMVDRGRDKALYQQWSDSVWRSVRRFGRNTQYTHKLGVSYSVPFSRIPVLSWLSSSASYSTDYRWDAAPRLADTLQLRLGNKLQNAMTLNINAQANLVSIYSKIPYLQRVNQRFDRLASGESQKQKQEFKEVTYQKDRFSLTAGTKRTVTHGLGSRDVRVKLYDAQGGEVPCEMEVLGEDKVRVVSPVDVKRGTVEVIGKKLKSSFSAGWIVDGFARVLMGLRSVSATYSSNVGTFLPGYLPDTKVFGLSNLSGPVAPGLPFVLGLQDADFPARAIANGWLLGDSTQNEAFRMTNTTTYGYRISIEPFPHARLDVTGTRTFARNKTEFYQRVGEGDFAVLNPSQNGNLSITTVMIRTAFESSTSKNGYRSASYERFVTNRAVVAHRLAEARRGGGVYESAPSSSDPDYPDGYGPLAQEVVIPALVAAYTGVDAERVSLESFPVIPLPNWQFTYDGLSRLPGIRDALRQLSLRHGYRATYAIGSYVSNDLYSAGVDGFSYVRNLQEDFIPRYQLGNVTLTEQFSPLVGVDMAWVNSLTSKFELRKNRSLSMSLANNQLTDMDSWEYVVGAGYRLENLPLLFKTNLGGQKVLKSDLRFQADFGVRRTSTILRRLAEGTHQPTAGQWSYTLKLSADYMITEQVTIRAFFDRMVNEPLVSLSFPTSNTSFGFSVRFTLEQ